MTTAIILAILAFATELLKTINTVNANKPPEQARAEALIAWGVFSKILKTVLPDEIKKDLESKGVTL